MSQIYYFLMPNETIIRNTNTRISHRRIGQFLAELGMFKDRTGAAARSNIQHTIYSIYLIHSRYKLKCQRATNLNKDSINLIAQV